MSKRARSLLLWVPLGLVALALDVLMIVGGIKLDIEIVGGL